MIRSILIFAAAALAAGAGLAAEQPVFADHFVDATLRIDYDHTGAAGEEIVALDRLYREDVWSGGRTVLIDELDLGRYEARIHDAGTGELLWSRGFDSYFGEWRTTGPAAAGVRRTYHETVRAPFPKAPVDFALAARGGDGELSEVFRTRIDPGSWEIRIEPKPADVIVVEAAVHGDPRGRVDVAILGEGYTSAEIEKFRADVKRFAGVLLGREPFASLSDRFNIWGVLKPSQQSGCDEPSRGVHRNTALGCTFDSLGSERYLLTEDNRAIRDAAGCAPYDVLSVMVNHERYGGGGIYNLFNVFTSDNQWSDYVFVHEFGHGFAGLADEYYSSSTAYTDFYSRDVEPGERNITVLQPDGRPKWDDLLPAGAPIPTPWPKAGYDAMDAEYQVRRGEINDRIAGLMRGGADAAEVEAAKAEGEELSRSHQRKMDEWFARTGLLGKVGVYEGAGYCAQGMYRSELDCIMFSKGLKPFCGACRRGIREVAAQYMDPGGD